MGFSPYVCFFNELQATLISGFYLLVILLLNGTEEKNEELKALSAAHLRKSAEQIRSSLQQLGD